MNLSRLLQAVVGTLAVVVLLAGCGGDSGEPTPTPGAQTSCFYQCNLGGGLSQKGCSSDSTVVATEDSCYEKARAACGVNVGKTGVIACDGCLASCAPTWWK
jgi:hypothetical protein